MIYNSSSDVIGLGGKGLTTTDITNGIDSGITKVYFHDPLTANSAVHFKQDVNFTPSIARTAEGTSKNTLYFAGNLGNTGGTLAPHPNNKQRYSKRASLVLEGGSGGGGGGGFSNKPFFNLEDADLQLVRSSSEGVKGGILFTPNPNIFFFNETDASASISGGLMPDSASAQIKFDTGSSALKFFAGSTTETLKEVLHISKSGDNPRIGIGISNPVKAFDFKEVRDDDRGGEILIRGSRTTRGADTGDEVGRINFAIDSASFNKIEVSGSAAEIVTIVEDVDSTGIQGSLSLRVSDRKSFAPGEILKIKSTGTETTGRIDATSVISGSTLRASGDAKIGDWLYAGAISIGNPIDPGSNNLQVNGNINVEGNSTLGNGSSNTVTIAGNTTASGNISASETITANSFVGTLTGTATGLAGTPDITVGSIEATSLNVTSITSSIVTSSILFTEGSNVFGDTTADNHTFTGSLLVTGSSHRILGNSIRIGERSQTAVDFSQNNNKNILKLGDALVSDDETYIEINDDTQIITFSAQSIKLGNQVIPSITASGEISSSGNIITSTIFASDLISSSGNITASAILASDHVNATNHVDTETYKISGVRFMSQSNSDQSAFTIGDLDGNDEVMTLNLNTAGANRLSIDDGGAITVGNEITTNTFKRLNRTPNTDSAYSIDTFITSSNNGAIYDYTLFSTPSGARAGQCMVIHHNGNTTFTDTSTPTLGSETSIPFFETSISGANVSLKIVSASGYSFRAFVKTL
jgi:hypothetical protein